MNFKIKIFYRLHKCHFKLSPFLSNIFKISNTLKIEYKKWFWLFHIQTFKFFFKSLKMNSFILSILLGQFCSISHVFFGNDYTRNFLESAWIHCLIDESKSFLVFLPYIFFKKNLFDFRIERFILYPLVAFHYTLSYILGTKQSFILIFTLIIVIVLVKLKTLDGYIPWQFFIYL